MLLILLNCVTRSSDQKMCFTLKTPICLSKIEELIPFWAISFAKGRFSFRPARTSCTTFVFRLPTRGQELFLLFSSSDTSSSPSTRSPSSPSSPSSLPSPRNSRHSHHTRHSRCTLLPSPGWHPVTPRYPRYIPLIPFYTGITLCYNPIIP